MRVIGAILAKFVVCRDFHLHPDLLPSREKEKCEKSLQTKGFLKVPPLVFHAKNGYIF
jgi:hypothetical protein